MSLLSRYFHSFHLQIEYNIDFSDVFLLPIVATRSNDVQVIMINRKFAQKMQSSLKDHCTVFSDNFQRPNEFLAMVFYEFFLFDILYI